MPGPNATGQGRRRVIKCMDENIVPRNKRAIDRVERFRTTELGAACWEKSAREIAAGWLSQPVPLADTLAESTNLTLALRFSNNTVMGRVKSGSLTT